MKIGSLISALPVLAPGAAEIQKQIEDPNLLFTTTPRNVQNYADFMFEVGPVKSKAAPWKDIYFPEIHHLPGS